MRMSSCIFVGLLSVVNKIAAGQGTKGPKQPNDGETGHGGGRGGQTR